MVAAQRVQVLVARGAAERIRDVVVELEVAVDLAALDRAGALSRPHGGGEPDGNAATEPDDAGRTEGAAHRGEPGVDVEAGHEGARVADQRLQHRTSPPVANGCRCVDRTIRRGCDHPPGASDPGTHAALPLVA